MAIAGHYAVNCPFCRVSIEVEQSRAGRETVCSRCGRAFVVPSCLATPPTSPCSSAATGTASIARLRTSSECALHVVCLVVAALIYAMLVLSCVGLVYLGFILLFSYVVLAFMMAHIRANGIKVAPDQLPNVYGSACRVSGTLRLAGVPEVYVIQAGGLLNAFATKFAFRRYVVLYSDLVDACGDNSAELDMIMAHEVGHLVLGHITWLWILLPAMMVPFLAQAYSRACEYSADRCGMAGCGNHQAAMRGLLILAAGGRQARLASLEAFLKQRRTVGGFWQTVMEWLSTHPWLTRRVEALHLMVRDRACA